MLFRGKSEYKKQWIEGSGCIATDNWASIITVDDFHGGYYEPPSCEVEEIEIIPETLGQYIGISDKNDVKIFTNDIIKIEYTNFLGVTTVFTYVIKCGEYIPNGYCKAIYKNQKCIGYYAENIEGNQFQLYAFAQKYEVIGNYYDNPELLKEPKIIENSVPYYDDPYKEGE